MRARAEVLMTTGKINHVAVIVAAIAFYVFSSVWFIIFSHQWQAMTGKSGAVLSPTTYIVSFLVTLVLAYVVGIALADSENPNMLRHGIEFGVFMSVGIWATNLFNLSLYEGRPYGLWALDAFQVVIGMAIMGAIIGGWRKRA
jgi:uncharacterized protein DUF1761